MSIILLLHLFMLTFTFGHVELLTVDYHSIDTPITELNNHTLREVFEDGNKYLATLNASDYEPAVTGWSVLSNVGSELKITRGTSDTIYYGNKLSNQMTLTNGNLYYLATYIKSNVSTNINISIRQSATGIQDSNVNVGLISNNYGIKSRITTITNYLNARILQFQITSSNTSIEIYHNAIKVIDLTSLGISSLTVEQMDTYFQMYQDNISANDVTYTQNEMTITDLTYILGFSFVWFIIIWSIRKVVL